MTIYLGYLLPDTSSGLTRGLTDGPSDIPPIWPCSGWGLPGQDVTTLPVSSYLAVAPLPLRERRSSFLWHFPESHLYWVLPSILPCGARTFLRQAGGPSAVIRLTRHNHNSRISAVLQSSDQVSPGSCSGEVVRDHESLFNYSTALR